MLLQPHGRCSPRRCACCVKISVVRNDVSSSRQFLQHARRGVAGGRIGIFAQRREDLDDRFLRRRRRDDLARRGRGPVRKFRHRLQRRNRGREADAAERRPAPARCSRSALTIRCVPRLFSASAWISSTTRKRRCAKRRQPRILAEQQREAFRRGDENVRRLAASAPRVPSATCRRCAGPRARRQSPVRASGARMFFCRS